MIGTSGRQRVSKDVFENIELLLPSLPTQTAISKTYPLKKVREVIYLNTGDIQDGKFLNNNFSNPENLPGQAKKLIEIGEILYSEIDQLIREICICKL